MLRSFGTDWGPTPSRTSWAYKAMVSYGAIVWGHKVDLQTELLRLQRLAMLAITGAQRSTPTKVLEMILGLVPIDLHVKSLGYMSFHHSKCLDLAGWDGIGNGNKRGHRLLWEKLGINALTNRLDPDDCIKSINFDINIEAVDVRNATASNIGIIKVKNPNEQTINKPNYTEWSLELRTGDGQSFRSGKVQDVTHSTLVELLVTKLCLQSLLEAEGDILVVFN